MGGGNSTSRDKNRPPIIKSNQYLAKKVILDNKS